ncbi:hypothetical protein [Parashewanella tropica]|uniref:hypothetical protein n=1 Tax=Parashewanella tropica TaxID=2547970 RepID=UPI001059247F|nr:hypothetical protein [Parashewanella tropica]
MKSEVDNPAVILCVIAMILHSVSCFAEVMNSHNSQAENNFEVFNSGQEYCDYQMANNPNIRACMPLFNASSHTAISIQTKEDGPSQKLAPKNILPSYFYDNRESFNIIVKNTETNQTIYSGPIYTIIGLSCDDSNCKPWN